MVLDRHPIRTKKANQPVASYSQGYRVGQFVFVSGQMPVDPVTNQTVEGVRNTPVNVSGMCSEFLKRLDARTKTLARPLFT